jgi:hypothetical protein
LIFVFLLCRLVALRAAWLIRQLARLPFTHALLLGVSLNLPQYTHNLLRRMLLSLPNSRLLSYQFLALLLVQKWTGTPGVFLKSNK